MLCVSIQNASATNSTSADDACYHNNIRNALSYGINTNKLGALLDKTYNFALQNRPQAPLALMQNKANLKSSAEAHASLCIFAHSGQSGVGENLFVGTEPSTMTHAKWLTERSRWQENAIADWAYEASFVSYPSGASVVTCEGGSTGSSCRSKIGHYTQMVWDSTIEVGCAAHYCPNGITNFNSGKSTNIVCHYSPQGNIYDGTDYLAPYTGQGVQPPANNPPGRQTCSTGAPGGSSGSGSSSGFPLSAIILLLNG